MVDVSGPTDPGTAEAALPPGILQGWFMGV